MRSAAVAALDPCTLSKFDNSKYDGAGVNMARTRRQKWLIGCLSAAGVLVLLSGLAIFVSFKGMDMLKKVPPESTQIVLHNDTNELLRIDRIDYGEERVVIDPVLAVGYSQNILDLEQIFGAISQKCRGISPSGTPA